MNIKKYVDGSGLTHLWTKIEENYPTNEDLINVINAIDETKVNKTDLNTLNILHNNEILKSLLEIYLLNIDYNEIAFDVEEITISSNNNSISYLGQGNLGEVVLS